MTQWIEISLRVNGEAAEAIATEIQRWVHQGVSIEQADIAPDTFDEGEVPEADMLIVRGYFPADERAEETRLQIERTLSYMNMMLPMPTPEYRTVAEEDWAEAWKAHYKPIRLGKRTLIRPLWIDVDPQPDDIVIALDPGMAFGTGTHPTTQLCLEALEWMISPTLDVLDLGCGSGILSIAAAKLGANKILALDIDPIAVKVTQENAAQNGVAQPITAQQGSLESVITSARRFDLVVVNILAKIIIAMCDQNLGDTVRPGGRAIFSGIIEEQAEDVEAALRKTGLEPVQRKQQGDWILIEARRPAQ
ncbi:MAG: 50S ribosomal protein L11 methyltransferase [Anaerolineae bacterium]|nr:50S ribosomal protein L11 methyltransferase [Anaerolineae bacterium]